MPALTAEEIRSIANKAVADVTRQKITTTKTTQSMRVVNTKGSGKLDRMAVAKEPRIGQLAKGTSSNPNSSGIQKSLAGSALSQTAGRGFFKDAFNKARKG